MDLLPPTMRILQDELPNIEVKVSSDYSPKLADALMKGRLDAASMRTESHSGGLVYKHVRSEPLIVVLPRGHRLAARKAIQLRDLKDEPFIKPSKTAPTLRKIIENSLRRSGLDLPAIHEVYNLAHAFSMIASTRAVTLLPQYAKTYLPSSVVWRPIQGEAPTVDLVVGYNKASVAYSGAVPLDNGQAGFRRVRPACQSGVPASQIKLSQDAMGITP